MWVAVPARSPNTLELHQDEQSGGARIKERTMIIRRRLHPAGIQRKQQVSLFEMTQARLEPSR